jgi:hypothetical protein
MSNNCNEVSQMERFKKNGLPGKIIDDLIFSNSILTRLASKSSPISADPDCS